MSPVEPILSTLEPSLRPFDGTVRDSRLAERWCSDRMGISVEVFVPAATTKPGSFIVREEKTLIHYFKKLFWSKASQMISEKVSAT